MIKNGRVEKKTKRTLLASTRFGATGKIPPARAAVAGRIFTEYHIVTRALFTSDIASGVPDSPMRGILENFVETIRLNADKRQVCNVSPLMLMKMQAIAKGSIEQSGSAHDAAELKIVKASNAKLVYTDGEKTTAEESITFNRAHQLLDFNEAVRTADDFRKYENIEFNFDRKDITQLLTDGNGAVIDISDLEVEIDIYAYELVDIQDSDSIQYFTLELIETQKTWKDVSYADRVPLNKDGLLSNLYYQVNSGAVGLPADDVTMGRVRLLKNGESEIMLDTTHRDLQASMLETHQMNFPYDAEGVRFIDGLAMIPFVQEHLNQAHVVGKLKDKTQTKNFDLELTTLATADLTKSAVVRVVQERLISPV